MTHTYTISGMTCTGCQAKVQKLLSAVTGIQQVQINLAQGEATIDMKSHVPTQTLQAALADYPQYQLQEKEEQRAEGGGRKAADVGKKDAAIAHSDHAKHEHAAAIDDTTAQSWLVTYKPILLIFGYITGITLLLQAYTGFHWMSGMNYFMAGFFLVFSFFKLLNLQGFADSYSMYDIIAKKWRGWGYVYAFTELALGIAYLLHWQPLLVNGITFALMSTSLVGVLQSVLNKRKIRCACLGDVFNLPMSTVTIVEDALMIIMSAVMLFILL